MDDNIYTEIKMKISKKKYNGTGSTVKEAARRIKQAFKQRNINSREIYLSLKEFQDLPEFLKISYNVHTENRPEFLKMLS